MQQDLNSAGGLESGPCDAGHTHTLPCDSDLLRLAEALPCLLATLQAAAVDPSSGTNNSKEGSQDTSSRDASSKAKARDAGGKDAGTKGGSKEGSTSKQAKARH